METRKMGKKIESGERRFAGAKREFGEKRRKHGRGGNSGATS